MSCHVVFIEQLESVHSEQWVCAVIFQSSALPTELDVTV